MKLSASIILHFSQLDHMYLHDSFTFSDHNYVRSVAMRFEKGSTDLYAWHDIKIDNSNNTNATSIYDVEGLKGDPIIDFFEMSQEELGKELFVIVINYL